MLTLIQWQNAWQSIDAHASNIPIALFDDVIKRYSEPHRHYHSVQHLDECLAKLAELEHLATHPGEIELALWFHDAIYEPRRNDNEELSADWAKLSILSAGLDSAVADRIHALIMATQHRTKPQDSDTQIMLDADLSILGASPQRFQEYEIQIRQEYAFVPETIFRAKRAEILDRFMSQSTIFNTPLFIERYEPIARLNLKHALENLCQI
ncbi:MAG: hypothetical protein IPN42_00915 [Methylococcaceae bacterium]|nr:hypothetical protein [Methylococcaceae bacterium]